MDIKNKDKIISILKENYINNLGNIESGLLEIMIDDFMDRVEDYNENTYLYEIIRDISRVVDGSYTCNRNEDEQIISENIHEYFEIINKMKEVEYLENIDFFNPEKLLVNILCFICEIMFNWNVDITIENFLKDIK